MSNPNKDKPALGRGARLVAGCAYPAVMAMAVTLHASLAWMGLSPPLAAYGAGLLAALLITWHEIRLPYRQSWKPRRPEVANDLLFLITVQVALPLLLAVSLVSVLAQYFVAHGIVLGTVWPHHLPVWFQVVLMLLMADFGRYWLHRAFHKFGVMWRFHAVHHSPQRLYWLNVGRFHPIEKAVQYVFDALPFTLVGVSGDVLAGYFTFYAVNGFYQHSNCLVWLGRLNYVISGPELHRWHHSMLALVWCLTNTVMKMRGHFGRRQGAMTCRGGFQTRPCGRYHARKSNAADGQKDPQIRKRICETPH